jgi:tRNA (guanine-N7-)-methyltransferase
MGRPLRKARQELVETLLPELRVVVPATDSPHDVREGARLDLAALFPGADQVWLEFGFGAGEHVAWQAAHHPNVGVLGCELFINGVASLVRHVHEQRLANVRIADTDSFRVLSALPEASIARAFLLFPDPWPKVRHHRRRFVRAEILDLLAKALVDGAEFRLATDHSGYCTWALARLIAHGAFDWRAERAADWRERPADWPPTRYEQRARAAWRSPVFLTFRRRLR